MTTNHYGTSMPPGGLHPITPFGQRWRAAALPKPARQECTILIRKLPYRTCQITTLESWLSDPGKLDRFELVFFGVIVPGSKDRGTMKASTFSDALKGSVTPPSHRSSAAMARKFPSPCSTQFQRFPDPDISPSGGVRRLPAVPLRSRSGGGILPAKGRGCVGKRGGRRWRPRSRRPRRSGPPIAS